jgi:hypothetical protein
MFVTAPSASRELSFRTISMLPACLVVVLTITMAVWTERMVQRHVIVRKLSSLEAYVPSEATHACFTIILPCVNVAILSEQMFVTAPRSCGGTHDYYGSLDRTDGAAPCYCPKTKLPGGTWTLPPSREYVPSEATHACFTIILPCVNVAILSEQMLLWQSGQNGWCSAMLLSEN